MHLQLLRNATLKLRYAHLTILIDPYFADKHAQPALAGNQGNPTVDLPIPVSQILEGVDLVLVSHLHPDHFDEAAQSLIPKDMPMLCQPTDLAPLQGMGFTQVQSVDTTIQLAELRITRTDGQHGSGEILKLMGTVSGFVFSHPQEPTLYWIGDSIWYEGIQRSIKDFVPEVIVCHAGGNKFPIPNTAYIIMDKEQVLALANFAHQSRIVATHMEALDLGTETRTSLRHFLDSHGVSATRFLIPSDGEELLFY